MVKNNIKIKTLTIPSTEEGEEWFKFIEESRVKTQGFDLVKIDFNNRKHLDPDDLVVLACLIEIYFSNGAKIEFLEPQKGLDSFLFNIKFKEYWNRGFKREDVTVSRNKTTLCLWKITKERMASYSTFATEYYKSEFFESKDLVPLSQALDEAFNNIFDHSNSELGGYIMMQYYPSKNRLVFCICDFGEGISNTVNEYRVNELQKKPIKDGEAIYKALKRNFTVHSTPRNRGLGLYNIDELIDSSEGVLEILSNNGFLKKEKYKTIIGSSRVHFQGTFIKVEIDLNTFDELDEEKQIFEF